MSLKETTKNITKELTTGLPPWSKGVVTIAVLGGIGYGIYKLIANINKIDDKLAANKEENLLQQQGQKYWYTKSQYKEMADQFYYNAIDTFNPFDRGNEDALYKLVGQMKSDLDILGVREAFGEKRCTMTINYMPLPAFINCMYDTDEVEQANKILASKKINFRF
jgi:hypothetical protein